MIKRILICILFFACCPTVFAGSFFNVSATGPAGQISMTLCLNGKGPLSCQNYTTSALNLSITTAISGHTYPNAGIKINTPGYVPAGCTMNANGYCLFSASKTTATTIPVTTSSCQGQTADLIAFSPAVTRVNNPTGGTPNPSQQFTINMTMCNSQGQPIIPSTTNPIHVNVYGAPNGVITLASPTSSTGLVTFTYNGQSFPNNILINAWITDSTDNGVALGQTQILQQNSLPCNYGGTSYPVQLTTTLPDTLSMKADVGYSTTSSTSTLKPFTLDTGSLGVVVPLSELGNNAEVIGPGPAGLVYYDSSGYTFSGNYYLAPVRIQLTGGATVQTQPIMVLAINKAYCAGPATESCHSAPPPSATLHYIGVGFNRPGGVPPVGTTPAGEPILPNLFASPTANAFLHITNASNGTDVSPGYYLTPGDTGTSGLSLGINSTTNYLLNSLTPSTTVPGDFLTESGCYTFKDTAPAVTYCGTLLVDVGIQQMYLDLPKAQWPGHSTVDDSGRVVAGQHLKITAGDTDQLSYSFTAVTSCPGSTPATPCFVQMVDSTLTGEIFINTGRNILNQYNVFYQGQCGQMGFYNVNP